MQIKFLNEDMELTPSQFANLYFDKLNLINKYSWMTIPPRILWKKINEYSKAFNLLDKVFLNNGIKGDIDYHIADAYKELSVKDKIKVVKILKGLEGINYFRKKD